MLFPLYSLLKLQMMKNMNLAQTIIFLRKFLQYFGMVQFHMPKGNTFQAGAVATNNHNRLSKQELREKWQLVGFRKVLPCSEPGQYFGRCERLIPQTKDQ